MSSVVPHQHRGVETPADHSGEVSPLQPAPTPTDHTAGDTARDTAGDGTAPNAAAHALVRLSGSGRALADAAQDLSGRHVRDASGAKVGTVEDLLIDPVQDRVRMLLVTHGGLLGIGADHIYLPVEAITASPDAATRDEDAGGVQIGHGDPSTPVGADGDVHVDQTRQQISGAPTYDPDLTEQPPLTDQLGYYGAVYGYYGYAPFWDDPQRP